MVVADAVRIDKQRFADEGYLVVEDVLDVGLDIDPLVDEYRALLEQLTSRWHGEGKLASTYGELPFAERIAHVLTEMGMAAYQPFDISLPISGQISEDTPMHLGPAMFRLLTSPRLIDAIEQFIGPEILSNPIQHVRIKPPERLLPINLRSNFIAKTEWHQDQGVALPEVDETDMLTVWIPITDATIENGCLCVVPKSHKQGLAVHCPKVGIPEVLRGPEFTPLPVKRGGAIFMHRRTMHSSLSNESNGGRWSLDLRYQPIGQPTGRPVFPAFVVRSRSQPETEVHDGRVWADLWQTARSKLASQSAHVKVKRWTGDEPVCA